MGSVGLGWVAVVVSIVLGVRGWRRGWTAEEDFVEFCIWENLSRGTVFDGSAESVGCWDGNDDYFNVALFPNPTERVFVAG